MWKETKIKETEIKTTQIENVNVEKNSILNQFNAKLKKMDNEELTFEKETLKEKEPSQILLLGMHHSVIIKTKKNWILVCF